MRTRFLLGPDLAAILIPISHTSEVPFRFDAGTVEGRPMAIEQVGERRMLVVATSGIEDASDVGEHTFMALSALLHPCGSGRSWPLYLATDAGDPIDATAFLFEGAGEPRVLIEAASVDEVALELPARARALPDASGTAAYAVGSIPLPAPASPADRKAFESLFAPMRQSSLAMAAIASQWDGLHETPPWEVIEDAARDLGMGMSVDKADVRTALAPIVARGDARTFFDGIHAFHAEILVRDALYVLREREGPRFLGVVGSTGPDGVELSPKAPVPALLTGEEAMELARCGSYVRGDRRLTVPGNGAGDCYIPIICGAHPGRP